MALRRTFVAGGVVTVLLLIASVFYFFAARNASSAPSHPVLLEDPLLLAQPSPPAVSVAIAAVSNFVAEMRWIQESFPSVPFFPLSRKDGWNPHNVEPNRAMEAGAFVRFIARHYDDLPDRVLFIHGQRRAWHVHGGDMLLLLRALRARDINLKAGGIEGWATLNMWEYFVMESDTGIWQTQWGQARLALEESGLVEFTGPLPRRIGMYCCAQFIVSRERIHRFPKSAWEKADKYLSGGKYGGGMNDKAVAVAMEHLWAFLFTGLAEEPQLEDACEILDCNVWKGSRQIMHHHSYDARARVSTTTWLLLLGAVLVAVCFASAVLIYAVEGGKGQRKAARNLRRQRRKAAAEEEARADAEAKEASLAAMRNQLLKEVLDPDR